MASAHSNFCARVHFPMDSNSWGICKQANNWSSLRREITVPKLVEV